MGHPFMRALIEAPTDHMLQLGPPRLGIAHELKPLKLTVNIQIPQTAME